MVCTVIVPGLKFRKRPKERASGRCVGYAELFLDVALGNQISHDAGGGEFVALAMGRDRGHVGHPGETTHGQD